MPAWWAKLRLMLSGPRALDDDLGAEIEAHLAFEIEENLTRGMAPDDARTAARRHMGNLTRIQERSREAWGFHSFETILQDARYALRGIRRSPGFSLVVILTLALGIGANTAIFSVVNAVLLRPLPYPAAERLLWMGESDPKAEGISVTWVNYQHWRRENHTFEDMAGFHTAHLTMTGRGEASFTRAAVVTSGFFGLTGAKPLLGRVFGEPDDRPGAAPTVVVGHRFWADKLGADPRIVGATLDLDGKAYEVIGVLSPGPHFFAQSMDLYLPLRLFDGDTADRSRHGSMRVLGRMRPGLTITAAMADLDAIMKRLGQEDPGPESQHRAFGRFLAESISGDIRPALLVLLGAVGLVLIIACANVVSLVLARSTARAREIAVRTAIGAGRSRLVRQLLTENLLVSVAGGISGLLLAHWCLRALIAMAPRDIPRLSETTFDWRVLLFAGAITLLTGIVTGLAPLLTAGRLDLVSALKDSSRTATSGRSGQSSRNALVIAEVAIALVLSFAAALLVRSLVAAEIANPGFAPDHLLALELVLPSSTYRGPEGVQAFYGQLKRDLQGLPGVTAVGSVNCPPSAGDCGDWFYSILDRPAPRPGEVPISLFNTADRNYFATMQIPLRQGRYFSETDRRGSPRVAIVNEVLARKWWPRGPAVGHRIKSGGPYRDGPIYEIAGVVGNVSQMGLDTEPYPEIYLPFSQSPSEAMVVMIRSAGNVEGLAPAVRRRVARIDRNLPIESLRPFEQTIAATLGRRRFTTLLLALFAGLAMALAAVGIFGLLSYWVRVREEEIAVRMALGAPWPHILRWTAWQVVRLALAGSGIGMVAGWLAARWLESLVFGVSARSLTTLVMAALGVIAIAVAAAAIPVWRATRVDAAVRLHRA
jgi:predicted permease